MLRCMIFFFQTQAAANQVVRILKESKDAVNIIIHVLRGVPGTFKHLLLTPHLGWIACWCAY